MIDDYGGFSGITEMAKNKEALAEKELAKPPKGDAIADAKQRMKKALDEAAKKEKEQKAQAAVQAAKKEQANIELNQQIGGDDRRLQLVSDIIDEMEKDQDGRSMTEVNYAKQKAAALEEERQPAEEAGFIKKYTDKQIQMQDEENYERKQATMAELGMFSSEPAAKAEPKKKGITERF